MSEAIAKLQELIDRYDNLVFFGGAGVSTESGSRKRSGDDRKGLGE